MVSELLQRIHIRLLNRMVLRPTRDALDAGEQARHEWTTPCGTLEYFVRARRGEDACAPWLILKFPGTGGRAERSTDFPLSLLPTPIGETWTLNPPGYGRSSGRSCLSTHVDVAEAFVRHAVARSSGRELRLMLCGNSLGCATVLGVAARLCRDEQFLHEFRLGLLLRNVPALPEVIRRVASHYPLGKLIGPVVARLPQEMNASKTAEQVTVPAVFLVSEFDRLVPPELQQQVHERYHGPKRLVTLAGLDHDGLLTDSHRPAMVDALRWLSDEISQGRDTK